MHSLASDIVVYLRQPRLVRRSTLIKGLNVCKFDSDSDLILTSLLGCAQPTR